MPKETELKYAVSAESWNALLKIDRIGEYVLDSEKRVAFHDVYADTLDRSINRHGFAFRIRSDGTHRVACLKSLSAGDGLGHSRDEFECPIGSSSAPDQWPAGEARNRFLAMTQDREMHTEAEIFQTRIKRHLLSKKEIVAELSLDEVRVRMRGREHVFFELEIEVLSDALIDKLDDVNKELLARFDLEPVGSSKFERAMALRDNDSGSKETREAN